jgi:hypothetical protein
MAAQGEDYIYEFEATIQGGGGGAFVDFPFDVREEFGAGRVPVRCTIDGEAYQGSLVKMGRACHMLLVLKSIREKIGKQVGDDVFVVLRRDVQVRRVEVPPELRGALRDHAKARRHFEKLSYSHQREYAMWISEAKKPETRKRRAAKAVEMLEVGKKLK